MCNWLPVLHDVLQAQLPCCAPLSSKNSLVYLLWRAPEEHQSCDRVETQRQMRSQTHAHTLTRTETKLCCCSREEMHGACTWSCLNDAACGIIIILLWLSFFMLMGSQNQNWNCNLINSPALIAASKARHWNWTVFSGLPFLPKWGHLIHLLCCL